MKSGCQSQTRKELRAANIDVQGRFVTSNATRKAGSKITTYLTRNNVTLTSTFTRYQPKVSPFDGKAFKKCSVVGNSGLLINSACGHEIDVADYVFRINVPEMDPYIQDVGYKTNFTTLNPSIFKRKNNYFASTRLTDKFNQDISQYQGLLMFPCFSDAAWVPICTRALQRLTPKKSLSIAFGDPDQFSLIRNYWVTKGLQKYPSTEIATAAIALCEEVHLYGFWPFVDSSMPHVTTHPVKYHYFDNTHMVRTHDMQAEFELLTRLHQVGVLRLHIRACSPERAGLGTGDGDTVKGMNREPVDKQQKRIVIEKLWDNV
ncbi:alpha-2,8-sialyltransferase 8B-like [Patiria miniata]|uniref:Uncharacterized protein n=1 Tax=Patiria miniata TaxID=46514 RepID=A0A914ASU9_PATMI|nr:alpha-2,8-sialyltransferase 8B-like [Patiria miniata]